MDKFDRAFELVIGHEGGYVNNPRDPGGETKFGISKRSYPHLDIRNLTLEDAKAIYRRDFWSAVRGDELPFRLGFNLFDGAVNSGPSRAIKWLQGAAGVAADGAFGPVTMAAVKKPGVPIVARYNGERLAFLADLPTWPTFGKGWSRRIASNLGM